MANWKRENGTDEEVLPPGYEPYDLGAELAGLSEREIEERAGIFCNNDGTGDEPSGQDFFG